MEIKLDGVLDNFIRAKFFEVVLLPMSSDVGLRYTYQQKKVFQVDLGYTHHSRPHNHFVCCHWFDHIVTK